ncbi:hypothetical protein SELMODRAFT_424429 [Selaginella moellendorffii]|uniref:Uncharacterized protein n=1 Tax=Selaginella moellendorffii TaxID=88036 RepID=D8SPV2_SELML|nr:hypothetical protein SELMODRAFT_424429 [Selaginella moellendorffii]
MDTQIDIGVIESVGTGAPEAAVTGGGVLASDIGGGGGAMPLVAEATHGEVDKLVEEVIGSVIGGFTMEATRGMVAAPTAPQASGAREANGGEGLCMYDSNTILNDHVRNTIIQAQEWTISKLVQIYWVRSTYDLNMAIYSSFVEVSCCLGKGTGKAPKEFIYNISKSKMSFAEQSIYLELLNTWLRNNEKRYEIRMEKMLQRAAISLLGGLRHSSHPSLRLQTMTWKSSPLQLCINRLVHPLSPTASVGEVAVLIGNYMQLLDATSWELYMFD